MEFMPVFSVLGSFLSMSKKDDNKSPTPAPVADARPVAEKVPDVPDTPGQKERAAVRDARKADISGKSLTTRSGVSIVGGSD